MKLKELGNRGRDNSMNPFYTQLACTSSYTYRVDVHKKSSLILWDAFPLNYMVLSVNGFHCHVIRKVEMKE